MGRKTKIKINIGEGWKTVTKVHIFEWNVMLGEGIRLRNKSRSTRKKDTEIKDRTSSH